MDNLHIYNQSRTVPAEALAIADGAAIVADTGELVPGVQVEIRPDKFSVEVL